jgi:hypothetical protein
MQNRDLVVVHQPARAELSIDMTDALHAEVCELMARNAPILPAP